MLVLSSMEIKVVRIANRPGYCIGKLFLDGVYFCDTIEDTDRGLFQGMQLADLKKRKVYSRTAIPTGRYKVVTHVISPKFNAKPEYRALCGGRLPRLLAVPGYDGILIHAGNTTTGIAKATMSAGCLLVGINDVVGQLSDSWNVFKRLYRVLSSRQDSIYITISRNYII